MTDHAYASLTNAQWASLIASTASAVVVRAAPAPARKASDITPRELAKTIDHTLLRLDATEDHVVALCCEARGWGFKTICVRLPFVELARRQLRGSGVGVTCVIGFHEGSFSVVEKVSEARAALAAGATELDVVLKHALFSPSSSSFSQGPNYSTIFHELAALRALASPPPPASPAAAIAGHEGEAEGVDENENENEGNTVTFKLILETAALHDYATAAVSGADRAEGMIIAVTVLAWYAGFDFVKTSTGFYIPNSKLVQPGSKPRPTGATTQDVALMRATCLYLFLQDQEAERHEREGDGRGRRTPMRVKASGGIRTSADARAMVEAGAERLGVSAGVVICEEAEAVIGGGLGERGGGKGQDESVGDEVDGGY